MVFNPQETNSYANAWYANDLKNRVLIYAGSYIIAWARGNTFYDIGTGRKVPGSKEKQGLSIRAQAHKVPSQMGANGTLVNHPQAPYAF